MQIQNGLVFCPDGTLKRQTVSTRGDRILETGEGPVLDASGCIVAPGFIDCHIHGACNHDFCEASPQAHGAIARYLASVGVTGYLGTTMAAKPQDLKKMMVSAGAFMDHPLPGHSVMRGIHLEGPFASVEKKGAMAEDCLLDPDLDLLYELNALSGGRIRIADVAPEKPGALEWIRAAAKDFVVSLHHTNADYECAKAAFRAGASHVTHLYNAMAPFSHRAPGLIGAAMEDARFVELICDGIHVHPSAIRAAFALFGEDRICLISDAMMACGMPDGAYALGGQPVTVTNGLAALENGTIAGSATALTECFRRAVKVFRIPLAAALKAVTINPATAIRMEDEIGVIAPGRRADFTILDAETLTVRHCIIGGVPVF